MNNNKQIDTTTFKNKVEFQKELQETVENLLNKLTNISSALVTNSSQGYSSCIQTKNTDYHFLVQLLKKQYKNNVFCSLFYKDVYRTELISCGAAQIYFLFVLFLLQQSFLKQHNRDLEQELGLIKKFVESQSKIITEDELKLFLKNVVFDQEQVLTETCWQALTLAGLEGKIYVENGQQADNKAFVIEQKTGFNFKNSLKPFPFFFLDKKHWQESNIRMLLVDGFIENISEIDHLLKECFEEPKQPLCIIASGFSEEVVSTLFVNFKNDKLKVFPLRLPIDINSINHINDIAAVCNAEPVSFLKGQMLSFVKLKEDCPIIDKLIITETNVSFINNNLKAFRGAQQQLATLVAKKTSERLLEPVDSLYDQRIKNLSPNQVVVYLPALKLSNSENETIRIKFDVALRQAKTLLNYGIIDLTKIPLEGNVDNIVWQALQQTIKELKKTNTNISSLSLYVAVMHALKTFELIVNSSGCVKKD